jgi:xanthine dehydrogenase YagR molybdenum-binding subunit
MADINITVGFEGQTEALTVQVPEGEPRPWDAKSQLACVGQRVPRIDARAKVTGQAKYTYDIALPGMLEACVARCPLPSARLRSVDMSRARAVPGVKAVWAEKPGKRMVFAGQEFAAVAAVSKDVAEDALRLIKADFTPLPFVVDMDKARAPGAPAVYPRSFKSAVEADDNGLRHNVLKHNTVTLAEGESAHEVERALAESDIVHEATFRTQVQTHAALEPHGSVVRWDGDHLTVWTSTQATFGVRDQLAALFDIPKAKVRVLCDYMGGGFGAKFSAGHWSVIAAHLARDARAPVKLMLGRHEEHVCTGNRPSTEIRLRVGAKHDGTLIALYSQSFGVPGIGSGSGATGAPAREIYRSKHRVEESDVVTNSGPAASFRAPGHPQGCFALEQAMDELAEKLAMDPVALRRKNLKNSVQVAELDRAVAHAKAWSVRQPPEAKRGSKRRGVGLACGVWYKWASTGVQVQIDVYDDGRVEVWNGAQDIGTGTRTVIAQTAAEELCLPIEAIHVRIGDTALPIGPGSGGSMTATSIVPAVRATAYKVRARMTALAARKLGAALDELELADGRFYVTNDIARGLTWKQVAASIGADKLSEMGRRAEEYQSFRERTGGVQIAEVEVDVDLGQVRVLRVTAVHDCGRVLNPLLAESQVKGGVIQGVSYALFENRVLDGNVGRMVNADLESYKIAFAGDCPEIDVVLFDVSNGGNNAGVIGLGESPTVPTAAAIANAVANAIGVRIRELPITPDRVLAALRGQRRS